MGIRCTSPSNRNYQLNFHRHPYLQHLPCSACSTASAAALCPSASRREVLSESRMREICLSGSNASATPSTRIPIFFFTIFSFCLKKCAPKRKRPRHNTFLYRDRASVQAVTRVNAGKPRKGQWAGRPDCHIGNHRIS